MGRAAAPGGRMEFIMRIFIVEDDPEIRELESYALESSGFETACFSDGESFFAALGQETPGLVLLDIMLPGEDGLSILKKLRSDPRTQAVPVIMVTAKTTEIDTIRGLDLGADDYIAKPFRIMELVSRVKARTRRLAQTAPTVISCGGVEMDDSKRTVTVDGAPCELTYKEYELLKLFLTSPGIVLSRDIIMERVWGMNYYEVSSRTVDMHVKTLRQKLGDHSSLIQTVRNVGYKLEAPGK